MENVIPVESEVVNRHAAVEQLLVQVFKDAGWRVSHEPDGPNGYRPDLLIRRPGASYVVELKVGVDGRSDRLVPLWSQACLQASSVSGKHTPLAIVAAPRIAPRVAENILKFAEQFAPDAAAGVIDLAGLRLFRGPQLESLNVEAPFLQAWLDVSSHPSRGEDQANLIRKRVLDRLLRGNEHG